MPKSAEHLILQWKSFVDVFVENSDGSKKKCNEAIYNFVAIDQNRNPISVPPIVPETQEEKNRFDSALRRKQLSLVLADKLKPEDANELKSLFYSPKNNYDS